MLYFFFFNDTATTEIYTLSLHDALPIWRGTRHRRRLLRLRPIQRRAHRRDLGGSGAGPGTLGGGPAPDAQESLRRSEEHTSELQSRQYLVCRLLLEKKKNTY